MIRFLDIRGQGTGCRFAFWDTTRDTFCSFAGEQAWNTRKEFAEAFVISGGEFADAVRVSGIERFTSLMPDWVDFEPTEDEL